MKGLSFHRPWLWAILNLPPGVAKDVDNRDKRWHSLIGERIALHSATEVAPDAYDIIEGICGKRPPKDLKLLPCGIVGVARVVDIIDKSDLFGAQEMFKNQWLNKTQPYALRLREVQKLTTPIACRGHQGIWDVPIDVFAAINEQLRAMPR